MLHKPTFRSCFRIEQLDTEGVLVLTETDYRVLKGHVERIAPLLTGDLTTDEIVERLKGEIPVSELHYTLHELEKRGYIVEDSQALPAHEAAYWDGLAVDANRVADRLQEVSVGVAAFGAASAEPMIAALDALGIGTGPQCDVEIVVTDDYLCEDLAAYNRDAVRRRRPFLLVKPFGTVVWIGPFVVPDRTGCWECLAQRLRLNRPAESFVRQRNGHAGSAVLPAAALPSTMQIALQIAATETAKWLVAGKSDALEGTLVAFDTRTLTSKGHTVVRRPQCPCCGDASPVDPTPIALTNREKRFTDDGGHRVVPPAVTLQAYEHHLSPITGLVRKLERLSGADNPLIHSYTAAHNPASRFEGVGQIRKNLQDISGGKGRTDVQARVSGLCEAIERCSGVYQGNEPRRLASYRSLGDEAIHPNDCLRFSRRQYRDREALNARDIRLAQWIPEPFDESKEIAWTPVWSLTSETFKYLPTAYCYYGFPPEQSPYCRADSNGNAAGNTLEEAILQGFMEVAERDGVALWWYNRLRVPGVDLDSFDDPYFRDLRAFYKSISRELWVLDITSDLEIPTFAALSRRTGSETENILVGFGAHFDARLAVSRALTEMNQVLPTTLRVENDPTGRSAHPDKLAMKWWSEATLANQAYLVPDGARRRSTDYPDDQKDDLLADVQACTELLEKRGLELLVLDQSRPDIGMPVVKVIVPGLRHYWPRFGPGRLYDVPVQLGLLSEPTSEDELNPFPIFF